MKRDSQDHIFYRWNPVIKKYEYFTTWSYRWYASSHTIKQDIQRNFFGNHRKNLKFISWDESWCEPSNEGEY